MNFNEQFEKHKLFIGFIIGICCFGFFILPEIIKETLDSSRPDFLDFDKGIRITNSLTGKYVCTVGIDCICMNETYYNNLKENEELKKNE